MSRPVFLSGAVTAVSPGAEVVLDGDEGRHAATVMRIRAGESVVLADGNGTSAVCAVLDADRASLRVRVESVAREERALPHVTVVQAIPKGDRGELAVEMLTEIDVDRIVPWAAARSVAVWRGDRAARSLAKWRTTARAAAKQARRAWLPEVTDPATTREVCALLAEADLAVVLHEEATTPLADLPLTDVGAFASAHVVRLGSSVLRTSTAGVAAVAAILSRTPRWR